MGCGKSSVGKRLSELLCCRFADLDAVIEQQAGCTVSEIFEQYGEPEFRRLEQQTLKEILEASATRQISHIQASPTLSSTTPKTELSELDEKPADLVLALGGGAVMTAGSDRMVHEGSLCIYLRTSVDELVSRLSSETSGRPLLKTCTDTSSSAAVASGTSSVMSGTSSVVSVTSSVMSGTSSVMSSEVETSAAKDALRTRILSLMSLRASTYEQVAHLIIDTDDKSIDQLADEIIGLL